MTAVIASGLWSSVWTWRHRAGKSHTLSLLVVLWGLVLGSIEVLPRIGYAKPDSRHLHVELPADLPPLPKPEPTQQPPAPQPTTPPQGTQTPAPTTSHRWQARA